MALRHRTNDFNDNNDINVCVWAILLYTCIIWEIANFFQFFFAKPLVPKRSLNLHRGSLGWRWGPFLRNAGISLKSDYLMSCVQSLSTEICSTVFFVPHVFGPTVP